MNQMIQLATEVLPSMVPSKLSSLVRPSLAIVKREADPDALRTVPEIIESRGFRAESYRVTTEDGNDRARSAVMR